MAGINLFFGALLGANLGAIGALPLWLYAALIFMLGVAAINILMIATSRKMWTILSAAAVNALLFLEILLNPALHPAGSEDQVQRIAVSMGVWLGFLLMFRLSPLLAGKSGSNASSDAEST